MSGLVSHLQAIQTETLQIPRAGEECGVRDKGDLRPGAVLEGVTHTAGGREGQEARATTVSRLTYSLLLPVIARQLLLLFGPLFSACQPCVDSL